MAKRKARAGSSGVPPRPDWLPERVYALFDPDTCINGVQPWQDERDGIDGLRETFRRVCVSPRSKGFWRGRCGARVAGIPDETWRIADLAEIARSKGRFRGVLGTGFDERIRWILEHPDPRQREKKQLQIRDRARELGALLDGTPFDLEARLYLVANAASDRMRRRRERLPDTPRDAAEHLTVDSDGRIQHDLGPRMSRALKGLSLYAERQIGQDLPAFRERPLVDRRRRAPRVGLLDMAASLLVVALHRHLACELFLEFTAYATEKATASLASAVLDKDVSRKNVKDLLRGTGRK